ncbi:transposase [Halomonas sp. MCCC 1A11036]|uniref:Transposase n=1 Tax=Billgrantia zhangzhouensis TaxID=2733481 RepID=A0ABS9ACB2_9GAMM|nr:transposase [Halomonas zhangzhouensis]
MARQATSMTKKTRTRYSQAYKAEALALADRVGASAAARELGLQPSQLYQWRAKAQQQQSVSARDRPCW